MSWCWRLGINVMCIITFIYKDMQCNVNIPLHIFTKMWCIVNREMPLSWYIVKLCNTYEKKSFSIVCLYGFRNIWVVKCWNQHFLTHLYIPCTGCIDGVFAGMPYPWAVCFCRFSLLILVGITGWNSMESLGSHCLSTALIFKAVKLRGILT